MGQKRRFDRQPGTSGPRKADIFRVFRYVSKVPEAEVTIKVF